PPRRSRPPPRPARAGRRGPAAPAPDRRLREQRRRRHLPVPAHRAAHRSLRGAVRDTPRPGPGRGRPALPRRIRPRLGWACSARGAPGAGAGVGGGGGAPRPPPHGRAAPRTAGGGARRGGGPAVRTLLLHGFAGSPRPLARFFEDAVTPRLPGHEDAPDAI